MKKGGSWLIVIAVFAVVAFLFLAGPNGLIRLIKMKQSETRLERRIIELKAEIELTHQKLDMLSSDPGYLRKVAAERLMMIDPRDSITDSLPDSTDVLTTDSSKSPGQVIPDTSSQG